MIFPVLEELGICCGIETLSKEYDVDCVNTSARIIMEQRLREYGFGGKEDLVQECLSSSAGMKNVERLWPNLLDEHSYPKLTSFSLEGCPKLLNVFPSSVLTRLQKLEHLSLWNCESLE